MPKRKDPVLNNSTALLIFNELDLYAKDKQFYPVQNALYSYMTKPQFNKATRQMDPPRYPDITRGTFDYWFERLVEEEYIKVDSATRAIRCVHLVIVERENAPVSLA
jgi:hypothetical protein